MIRRCAWAGTEKLFIDYHDREWGVPVHDERKFFEMLILEGAQAGLSWSTVLKKRDAYRRAFAQFDPQKVARFNKQKINELMDNPGIIRNRLKIESAVKNARAFLEIQKKFDSFDQYIWKFTGGEPLVNTWKKLSDIPAQSSESDAMSKDLKQHGFNFVGSTICYAFMQAAGMVNDHLVTCFRYEEVKRLAT